MSSTDGTTELAQNAAETPSVEAEQDETLTPEAGEGEAVEGDEQEADDSEEIEHDGAKYRIPKAVKPLVMMQADYTRKTQEVAKTREELNNERESFIKESEARRQSEKDIGRVAVMDEELEQYKKVDWQAFRATNPEQAAAAFQDYSMLRDRRDELATKVQTDVQKRSQEAQQTFAKRYAETNNTLARDIKGWNQDTANKLRDFAVANGASQQDILTLAVNAPLVKLLHKAYLGDQLIAKQAQAAKAARIDVARPTQEAQPLTSVTRRPSGNAKAGLHDGLSADEWLRRRNAQVKRK